MDENEIVVGGVHDYTTEERYVPPKEQAVLEHLKWFMGLKLGFMMHFSPGCQLGTYESWALCDEDAAWSQAEIDWTDTETFKKQYWNANRTFNPVKFRPDRIADLAKECGFRYLLFTTKHHDGFCMYDSHATDYKITDPSCPFSDSPYADITKYLFEEFRSRGMAISAYFSKPDWHSDAYWHRAFGEAPTRNLNYSVEEHPELWEEFVRYVHTQIEELGTRYGRIDCLWLDGGWVRPDNQGQDIRLGEIVGKLRGGPQPHLIVCDRTVGGEFENIVTPEQQIPEKPLFIPWETCTTVGENFGFRYDDHFKSGRELVHLLIDVVSRGGNLALNLSPQPDGKLPAGGVRSLKEMGRWLRIHGDGIYGTEPAAPYEYWKIRYTRKGEKTYAFFLYEDEVRIPGRIHLEMEKDFSKVTLMRTGEEVKFTRQGRNVVLDTSGISDAGAFYADCFVIC